MGRKTEWVIKDMNKELEAWGYAGKTVILRSDQEGAIESVKRGLAEFRTGDTMLEESPIGEKSGNGRAEDAGKRVREQARVLKDQIEWKTKSKLSASTDILKWLVRWAAMIITRYKVKYMEKHPGKE